VRFLGGAPVFLEKAQRVSPMPLRLPASLAEIGRAWDRFARLQPLANQRSGFAIGEVAQIWP